MAIAALPNPVPLWDLTLHSTSGSLASSGFVIDAASEKAAIILQAPKTGIINKIGFYVAAHTSGATLDCEVQTISASTGLPSGTRVGSSTTATVVTSGTGWYEATLATGAAVTKGDRIALVVAQPASSPGNCAIGDLANFFGQSSSHGFPFGAVYVASWAVASSLRRPIIYAGYDDSTYGFCPFNLPATSITLSNSINSSSTPDEVGNRFNALMPMRIVGARLLVNPAADGRDFSIALYNNAGSQLAIESFDSGQFAQGALLQADFLFDAAVDIAAGVHRMTFIPGTTSNNQMSYVTMPSATGIRYAMPGGVDTYWTERTDGGSFSDTNTRFALLIPLVQGFDDAAGGGATVQVINSRATSHLRR